MPPEIVYLAAAVIIIALVIMVIVITGRMRRIETALSEFSEKSLKAVREEFRTNREDSGRQVKLQMDEMRNSMKMLGDMIGDRLTDISKQQRSKLEIFTEQLSKLTETNEKKFEKLTDKVSAELKDIQKNNAEKLEEMRATVDEKLHATLEKRLGESFKLVGERLELVHKGLGEMQNLASGVGDLKKVLTNVKSRGTWGEVQLQTLIEQILAPSQYEQNVRTKKGSRELVEFAIKLPGRNKDDNEVVWLPIDAKFPIEDYQKLIDAREAGDQPSIDTYTKGLVTRIKGEAKNISTKYLDPPNTTDFAIMFLPVEGLYAEVLSVPGLAEVVQRDHRVIMAGPTNLAALLNSLQIGFRTLIIEKRSSEVWKLLGAVKTEFGKFGDLLEKTQTKLEQASKEIGNAKSKSRTIERKLGTIQELPEAESAKLLGNGNEEY